MIFLSDNFKEKCLQSKNVKGMGKISTNSLSFIFRNERFWKKEVCLCVNIQSMRSKMNTDITQIKMTQCVDRLTNVAFHSL